MQITHARTNDSLRRSLARRASLLGWLPVAAAVALSGCTTKKAEAPPLSGPSEHGLSLEMRVSPDVVVMDGVSQSTLTITSRDSNGDILPNTAIRVELTFGGELVDQIYGRLSTKNVTTGGDGRATVTYTAPNSPPSQNSDTGNIVTLIATPAGWDYRNAVSRQIDIRLVPQGPILPVPYSPVAKFTYSPTSPGEEADVVFDASSSIASCIPNPSDPNNVAVCIPQGGNTISSYQWDFGNGQTGSGVRPTTRFATRGTYNVKLVVTNDRGLSNQITQQVTVTGVANPTVDFAISPAAPGVGQQVFFTASAAQAAPGRTITSYDWDFGDGHFGRGITESHRYERLGTFSVTLTVTDSAGKTGTVTKAVSVGAGTTPAPTAAFTVSPGVVTVNTLFFLDATVSTASPGRTITRYQWNLGDNQIVEGPRIEHVYNRAGTYTITLTVTDSGGATDTETRTLSVN